MTVDPRIKEGSVCHGGAGEGDTGTSPQEEHQTYTALKGNRHLTEDLMKEVCSLSNLRRAYRQVRANKGSAGTDGMTVEEMHDYFKAKIELLREQLLEGRYNPEAVRGVIIPKPNGGSRQLGIPTVVDRVIQQAIAQVLEKVYEPTFSESSYGFRPRKGAHGALKQASKYVSEGYIWVVDLDLEQFFDRVNHDLLMGRLAQVIADKTLLRLIRRYLETGIMQDGISERRQEGTPQGSPLSPLLSNIMLDELDKELERRGHRFCRYADDSNVYVKSAKAGYRVMASMTRFLEQRLKLKVNRAKSAVALVNTRKFLGYRLQCDGHLSIAPESLERLQEKLRQQTRRNRGRSFELVIKEVNQTLRGWIEYFKLSRARRPLQDLDCWLRRKLRCYRLKQRKKSGAIVSWLMNLGIKEREARQIGSSGKGWWRLAKTSALHRALNQEWFEKQGLLSLETSWERRRVTV